MAKVGELVLPAPHPEAEIAPLVVFDGEPSGPLKDPEPATSLIEIIAGAVTVRLDGTTPAERIAEIVRALGVSA